VIGRDCISVVIVDDSSSVCDALYRLLNGDRGVECVASTGDGAEARRITDRLHPGIVLLDIEMPGVDTFALLRWIVSNHPWTKVLMISGYVLPALIERSLDDGAAGYIHKGEAPAEMVDCIRRAAAGEIVLGEAAREFLRGAVTR